MQIDNEMELTLKTGEKIVVQSVAGGCGTDGYRIRVFISSNHGRIVILPKTDNSIELSTITALDMELDEIETISITNRKHEAEKRAMLDEVRSGAQP